MKSSPLVSVCIPVYNGKRYLQETLRSVCSQTYSNVEILVQDNASVDGTAEVINLMMRQDARIKVERNTATVSMAVNWNLILRRPNGKYVLLLSADDLIDANFLQKCVNRLETDPELDFVSTEHRLLEPMGVRNRRITSSPGKKLVVCTEVLLKNPFSINFTLFRRQFLDQNKMNFGRVFRDPYFTCDYDLWIRSASVRAKVFFEPTPLATYRVHDASLSSNRIKMLKQTALVLAANRAFLESSCPFALKLTFLRLLVRLTLLKCKKGLGYARLWRYLWRRAL
jgi:glycosyltransferase involved in cell wall biosynthesis